MKHFKPGDLVRRTSLGGPDSKWRDLNLGVGGVYKVKRIVPFDNLLVLGVGEVIGWDPIYFELVESANIEEYI